jgi:hypothetical protein
MPASILPASPGIQDQAFSTVLQGATYKFRFRWNPRSERWIMDVMDVSGNELVNGIVVAVVAPLLSRFRIKGLPPGDAVAFSGSLGSIGKAEAGLEDLTDVVQVIYVDG